MSSPVPSPKNADANNYRKGSSTYSYSSDLEAVEEEHQGNLGNAKSSARKLESIDEPSPIQQMPDEQTDALTEKPMERIKSTPCAREIMKTKIRYHFMNPLQKFRARRRKPWKLLLQIVKIVLVTIQICLFGFDRFSLVTFLENNHLALKHLFLKDYKNGDQGLVVFTRAQFYSYLHYAHEQYYRITTVPLGAYDYTGVVNGSEPPPMRLCYSYYAAGGIENNTFKFDPKVNQGCIDLNRSFHHDHAVIKNNTFNLGRLRTVQMKFNLKTVNLKNVKAWDRPTCYQLNITILFDNVKHDGRMPVQLLMNNTFLPCKKGNIKGSDPLRTRVITETLVVFDAVVILICTLSLFLCVRSVYRSSKLAKEAARFFKEDAVLEDFTFWDYREFVSMWFFVIMISDSLTIIGLVYKMAIDQKDSDFYDVCSIFLGIAVLLVWIGLLRFLSYSKKYNILLLTLKAASPSMMRFVVCVSLLFAGFMFCGWFVLGPFHHKFKTLPITAECLYSMINGDDLFNTFAEVTARTPDLIWIFSKIYLYVFISLFIYVVLSLFIGIIGDTYERIRDLGHLPESKVKKFIHEPVNVGRSARPAAAAPVPSEACCTIQTREVRGNANRRHSSTTQDPIMNIVSVESTGAE
ncbi:mucolipin-3-like [Montipora capricornis]|uniref:mucolipin-3-like n=1 Tax=Montipora capricornis TaxID=246305 RepID=UPI0035F11EFC